MLYIVVCSVPGSVVSVLTAGLQVQVVQCPVLQLLAEVLDTHLKTLSYETRKLILGKPKLLTRWDNFNEPENVSWF